MAGFKKFSTLSVPAATNFQTLWNKMDVIIHEL